MNTKKDFWKTHLKRFTVLDPPQRLSEVLFGLIMVLSFTGTISVSTAGKQNLRELIWAALGCNLAWGLVDAIMYLMDTLIGRARHIMQLQKIKAAKSEDDSRKIIRDNLPPLIVEIMNDEEIDHLREKIKKLPEVTIKSSLTLKDFFMAGQIFLLVFLSTFPVALPLLLFKDVAVAMRISNGVALVLMFAAGYKLARYSGMKPFATAIVYAAIGIILVILTIILGG